MEDQIKPDNIPQQIQINTGDDLSRGRYSNSMMVSHGPDEFILDWLLNSPNGVHLVSRVIVSPGHIKRMIDTLRENLDNYEKQFGDIKAVNLGHEPVH